LAHAGDVDEQFDRRVKQFVSSHELNRLRRDLKS
jgi:hypothetical protein